MTETAKAQGGKSGGFHYAYLIVLSCIMITCLPCALALSCAGIFFTPVSEYLGVARAQFTLYFSILNVAMMLTLPVAGKLMGKSDLRVVLSAGVALTGAGLLLMGRCSALWQFYLCGAVMGVGVAPLIYLGASASSWGSAWRSPVSAASSSTRWAPPSSSPEAKAGAWRTPSSASSRSWERCRSRCSWCAPSPRTRVCCPWARARRPTRLGPRRSPVA